MSYARSYVFYGHMVQGKVDAIERLALVFSRLDVLEAHCGWILGKGCKCVDQTKVSSLLGDYDLIRREARAQAYEEIAEHINKPFACPLCKEELEAFYKHHCAPGNETLSPMQSLRIWLRSESKRIRESK